MDQTLREEKQLFLQNEIVDKEYDSDLFTLWIETQRPDGGNIDNWSLEELRLIVDEFQRQNPLEKDLPNGIFHFNLIKLGIKHQILMR